MTPYTATSTLLACFSIIIYNLAVKDRDAKYFLAGFVILFLVGVFDMVFTMHGLVDQGMISSWGLFVFILFLAVVLANRFVRLHSEVEDLNINLEAKVVARTEELREAMEELQSINVRLKEAREALWGEMLVAKRIQTILLPLEPIMAGYEITAFMEPADEVGGDYYDIINTDRIDWIVIGDVSGHGVPAGLIMMMVQTSIHTVVAQHPELGPAELLVIINRVIRDNISRMDENKYMTITVAWLKGSVIGKRDPLIDMFWDKRLKDILLRMGECPVEDIRDGILRELDGYDCDDDDITMMVVRRV